jgi:GT2 family glycosyltransferase
MKPNVSIIILNWNGYEDTLECLESLYQIDYPNYNVIVVDNGSEDDSIKIIKDYCAGKIKIGSDFFDYDINNKPIDIYEFCEENSEVITCISNQFFNNNNHNKLILIKNNKNYGFAEGNNIAIKFVINNLNSDYILLLNNDTVTESNFLEKLVSIGTNDTNVGIIGPNIYYYDSPNLLQSSGAEINWNKGSSRLLNNLDSKNVVEVDYVSGCALLAKTELFSKIGFLNSEYFAYWEEADFCIRAINKGYKVINISNSKVYHKISSSTGKKGVYHYYMRRNMFWFMKQHASLNQRVSFFAYYFLFKIWVDSFSLFIYKKDINSVFYLLKGTLDGLFKNNKSLRIS